ncbi:MAG: O-antigen ligase family protein [Pontixanthobacter sp.]
MQTFDLIVFYATVFFIAVLGGSSRYDLVQVVVLQPLLWICLAIAVLRMHHIRDFEIPVLLAVVYGLWLSLQLIPLPFAIWSQLAGREPIAAVDLQLIGETWRPLSLTPSRTLNALAYLPALLAPMIAAINLGRRLPFHVVSAILAIAVMSGLIGLVQILTGSLYFYSVTIIGRAVGLFANPNHTAVFGSIAMVIAGAAALVKPKGILRSLLVATAVLLLFTTITNGSRAGLATLMLAIAALLVCVWFSLDGGSAKRARRGLSHTGWRIIGIGAATVTIGAIAMLFIMSDRIPALQSLAEEDPLSDSRFRIFPVLVDMVRTYFPWGIGVGAFEESYYISEPAELLKPNYLNMAHNDIIQVVIEGGIIGVGFIVAILFAIARAFKNSIRLLGRRTVASLAIGIIGVGAIVFAGSAFDYPLRTPIFQATLAMLFVLIYAASHQRNDHETMD